MFSKKKSIVGLDIGSRAVKAVELADAGGGVCVTGIGWAEIPSRDALKDTVADLLRRAGIKSKRVATSVSGRSVIVRYVNMVEMSDEDLASAMRFEADKYIPFEIDEVVLDCQKVEVAEAGANGQREMRVLLAAVKRSLIDEHVQLFADLGLIPTIIDVDSFALGNAFELRAAASPRVQEEERVVALVDVGASKTNINIMKGTASYFSREVYLAGNDFTEAISRRLGVDAAEAERLKLDPKERQAEVEEATSAPLDDLANEVHLSFDYYENQFDREVDEVYVSGGGARLAGLEASFERAFHRKIQFWDPTENIELRTERVDLDELRERSGQLAVAVGLASRILTL
ncbi:MAG: type IV pilus assembly protein PilM [Planctomycetes bacterium]|nr:type IV pilus assembly protein PilM [Planctomycetota bacterium]